MSMVDKMNNSFSNSVYIFKAFAIYTVITAHMRYAESGLVENIRLMVGTIGVVGFFIFAGYYYKNTEPFASFAKKKLINIIVPWVVCSLVTFIIACFTNPAFERTLIHYFKYFMGSYTWYYFIPTLLFSFLLFRFFKSQSAIIILIIISLISIYLTTFNVLSINGSFFTDYLNPFNWLAFFGLGLLIKSRNIQINKFTDIEFIKDNKLIYTALLIIFIILSVVYFNTENISYWGGLLSIPFELFSVFFILIFSQLVSKSKLLVSIGKNSLVIYLLHLQLGDIINARVHLTGLLFFIKPLLVVLIFQLLIYSAFQLSIRLKMEKYLLLLGIKEI